MQTVTNIINKLNIFWSKQNCSILQPIDLEVGAGTFHPLTFFKSFDREKWMAAFTQTCRRPSDIKNTTLNIKWQKFNQYQVIMKPSPLNIKNLYLKSLKEIGINLKKNEILFIEDDWKSPSLNAWGLGWEVWINGMESTQFTYFQQVGGVNCIPTMVEIAYGIERIALTLQKKKIYNRH